MQHLEVSGAVRPLKWSLGVKWLTRYHQIILYVSLCGFLVFWCLWNY